MALVSRLPQVATTSRARFLESAFHGGRGASMFSSTGCASFAEIAAGGGALLGSSHVRFPLFSLGAPTRPSPPSVAFMKTRALAPFRQAAMFGARRLPRCTRPPVGSEHALGGANLRRGSALFTAFFAFFVGV
jgi:hypothetical protein